MLLASIGRYGLSTLTGLRRAARGIRSDCAPPRVPNGLRVYAFGDIHGRFDLLDQMLDRLDADLARSRCPRVLVIFLGDYVDRGPDSAKVIDRLIEVQVTHKAICLRGNHEVMFERFLRDPRVLEDWSALGGLATLVSYGLKPPPQPRLSDADEIAAELVVKMPGAHRTFLKGLGLTFSCGDYFFVHAGVRPRVPLHRQIEDDCLWIREEFLVYERMHEKFIVHGHSPVIDPDVRANRVNIDTGAFATGRLTCIVLEEKTRRFL